MAVERDRGIFTLEGALSVQALLDSRYVTRSVLVAEEHAEKMAARLGAGAPLFAMPAAAMTELTGVHFHRGVLAVAERPELPALADLVTGARTIVVLEGVNDHENIGSIFRNAAAFGVDAVMRIEILVFGRDPLHGNVIGPPVLAALQRVGIRPQLDQLRIQLLAVGRSPVAVTGQFQSVARAGNCAHHAEQCDHRHLHGTWLVVVGFATNACCESIPMVMLPGSPAKRNHGPTRRAPLVAYHRKPAEA